MSDAQNVHAIVVAVEEAGQRLDQLLAARLAAMSRSRVQDLIRAGHLSDIGGTILEASRRVKPGETFTLVVPEPAPAEPKGEAISLAIVYEDAHVIVVDKPAGLVVHPAAGHADGTLVNALISHCGDSLSGIGGVRRPGIVHRLDKDTSGLLVVAKSDAAHQGLAEQFAAHGRDGRLLRSYMGIAWGAMDKRSGRIEAPLARSHSNRLRMAVVRTDRGREAITHYAVERPLLAGGPAVVACLLRLRLETGRTHQIRVHLAHAGHPLLGDSVYGAGFAASARKLPERVQASLAALGRQALHAAELGFEHPVTGKPLWFESPLPADLADLVAAMSPPTETAPRKPARRPAAGSPTRRP